MQNTMRKLKLQVQMTVDGFIAGPKGEMDFMEMNWDDELINYIQEITDPVDCIVLGRQLAQGFIPYWAGVAANRDHQEHSAGKKFTDTTKIVFTKTLQESDPEVTGWKNTVLEKGDLVTEITALKSREGGDIIAYGGASFVSSLIRYGLIDEFHLLINPTAIGNGMTIFKELAGKQNFRLVKSFSFECGIVLLNYKPKTN